MDSGHLWMVEKLAALEEFAKLNNWYDVADLLCIARRAASGDLKNVSSQIADQYQNYEDGWFENAIDQLTRHAHERRLPQVEAHLMNARAAWDRRNSPESNKPGNANNAGTH